MPCVCVRGRIGMYACAGVWVCMRARACVYMRGYVPLRELLPLVQLYKKPLPLRVISYACHYIPTYPNNKEVSSRKGTNPRATYTNHIRSWVFMIKKVKIRWQCRKAIQSQRRIYKVQYMRLHSVRMRTRACSSHVHAYAHNRRLIDTTQFHQNEGLYVWKKQQTTPTSKYHKLLPYTLLWSGY